MSSYDFKLQLLDELTGLPVYKKMGDNQIMVRCPFCGDSIKNTRSTHFGVKVDLSNEDMPILFNCFRCGTSGVLTPDVLRSINIYDMNLNSGLTKYNKSAIKKMNKKLGINSKDNYLDLKIPYPSDMENALIKKAYIENRLGIEMSIDESIELKVIYSLKDFLKLNNINSITTSKEMARLLNNDYVGFLTVRKEFINFRDINKNKLRYFKYAVFNTLENTRNFYTIPNSIDILTQKNIIINLTEGVFDTLGLYFNIFNKSKENIVYAAVCGTGFTNVLKYFIRNGVFGENVEVNIFSDADRYPVYYRRMRDELNQYFKSISLFYNEIGKDYGVTKDEIKLIKKRIP